MFNKRPGASGDGSKKRLRKRKDSESESQGMDAYLESKEKSSMRLGVLENEMQAERIALLKAEAEKVLPILRSRLGKDGRYLSQLRLDVMGYSVDVTGDHYDCAFDIEARFQVGRSQEALRNKSVKFYGFKDVPMDGKAREAVVFSAEELAEKLLSDDSFKEMLKEVQMRESREMGANAAFAEVIEMKMEEMLPILRESLGEKADLLKGLELDVRDLQFDYHEEESESLYNTVYYNIDVYADMGGQTKQFKLASEKVVAPGEFENIFNPEALAQELLDSSEFQLAVKEAKKSERIEERVAKRSEKSVDREIATFKKRLSEDTRRALASRLPDPSFVKSIEFDDRVTDISYDPSLGEWDLHFDPIVTLQKDGQTRFYERGINNLLISKPGGPDEISINADDIAQAILDSSDLRMGRHVAALEAEKFMETDDDALALNKGLKKGREKLGDWYKLWKKSREEDGRDIALSHLGDELKQLAGGLKVEAKQFLAKKSKLVKENQYLAEAISNIDNAVDAFDDEVAVTV